MTKPLHIICGNCGSLDLFFEVRDREEIDEGVFDSGVSVYCNNCYEITSIESFNNWNKESVERYKKDHR